jgi:hypothetical protein
MKKRILSLFLVAMIACSVFAGLSVSAVETKVVSTASDDTSGTTGNCSWGYDDSTDTLTISGNGKMGDYIFVDETPWYEFNSNIKSVVITSGVTNIGNSAFEGCSSLADVTIPDSVTTIGYSAFYECTSLADVTIPNSVTSIGERAFIYCTSLTNVTIPNSVKSIGQSAFYGCTCLTSVDVDSNNKYFSSIDGNLYNKKQTELIYYATGKNKKSFIILNGVTIIGEGAFEGCTRLTNVTIPNSVKSIKASAFAACTNLESIKIPDSVTAIGEAAFVNCSRFKSITIPKSVTSIGYGTFGGCENLTSVTIPKGVTNIGFGAFNGCSKLTNIYYKGTKSQWNKIKIDNSYNGNTLLLKAKIHCQDGTINATAVKLAKSSATLYRTGKTTIKATVKNGKGKTTYKSSNTKVAKVNSKGVVTALKKGTAKITVTNNGVKKTFKVTVKNPKLNATKKTLKVKKNFTLKITGKVGTAKFTSSNKKIATVNSKGKITAKKKGTAYITVKTNGIKLKCKITVKK